MRIVILIAVFYFFVNFNPFSVDVLYFHMSEELGYSEQFIGYFYTVGSVGAILSAIVYALFAKKIPLRLLLHGSVFFMVLSTLLYIGMKSETSAIIISISSGFIYMITNLTQLELASRYCPPAAAGTVFALLMSVSNLTISLSSIIGSKLYESWKVSYGADTSYSMLVLIGAGFTAVCWLLVLLFPKTIKEYNQS
jgi:predicted MFS family arabinose efflux permease